MPQEKIQTNQRLGYLYCGIKLNWNYNARTLDILMSGYIILGGPVQDLSNFQMTQIPFLSDSTCSNHSPHDILKV
jgi:hypothetical protein